MIKNDETVVCVILFHSKLYFPTIRMPIWQSRPILIESKLKLYIVKVTKNILFKLIFRLCIYPQSTEFDKQIFFFENNL